jgi:hypothetical protein
VIGTRRLWRRRDLERWCDAKPRVWSHSGGFGGRSDPPRSKYSPKRRRCPVPVKGIQQPTSNITLRDE